MDDFESRINTLKDLINNAKRIVFFSGAGVSTASGIPDFRSENGLYSKNFKNFRPEEILSRSFWKTNPKLFYEFYFNTIAVTGIKPNIIHNVVASWSKNKNQENWTITQNIDNLDMEAGNRKLLELHGNVNRNYCYSCSKFFNLSDMLKLRDKNDIPRCDVCNSVINPDVVLYEDPLLEDTTQKAANVLYKADLLIIAGTSLSVHPANMLINYYQGDNIIIMNKSKIQDNIHLNNKKLLTFDEDLKDIFNALKQEG